MRRPLLMLLALAASTSWSLAAQRRKPPSLDSLETVAARDSLDPAAQFQLSIGYWRAKRYDDQVRALKRTIAIDPRYAPAYLWLADVPFDRRPKLIEESRKHKVPREWQDSLEESRRLNRAAVLINPMVDFRVVGVQPPPEDMLVLPEEGEWTTFWLLVIGVGAFGDARYQLSYAALQKWVEREYKDKPVDSIPDFLFWFRGLAAAHRDIYTAAIADFKTLLARWTAKEKSDSATQFEIPIETNDCRYILALLYERSGQPADAVGLYKEAIANDLGLFMAHVRLAQMYRQFRQWNEAIVEAQRAIEANPDDPVAVRELGEIFYEARRPADAEASLRQALERHPQDPRTYYVLGRVYQDTERPALAREHLARFLALAPAAQITGPVLDDAKRRLETLPGS